MVLEKPEGKLENDMNEQELKADEKLVIYTHDYCPQSHMLADALKEVSVEIEWRDVRVGAPKWQEELKSIARGYLSVPTVVFGDGTVMVEPWPQEVMNKLGVQKAGFLKRVFGRRKETD